MNAHKAKAYARLLLRKNTSAYHANKWTFAWKLNQNKFFTESAFLKIRLASPKYSALEKSYILDKLEILE